jgi:uncharacterized YccA/Bax inhibitor family protein
MMRSGNPALKGDTFQLSSSNSINAGSGDVMTLQGTVNKSLFLFLLVLVPATFVWNQFFSGNSALVTPLTYGGAIAAFVVALILVFKKTMAPFLAPLYAVLEGLFLGGVSAMFEMRFPGIVIQAVGLTFGVFAALLLLYKSRVIRATENFKLGVAAATGGIMLVYLATFILGFFGIQIPAIHESGLIGIGFSLFVVVIAAMNLVMDFDFIEEGAERGAPKYMEWYGSFGLLVTLCWLYLEMLRLLSKLQSRD